MAYTRMRDIAIERRTRPLTAQVTVSVIGLAIFAVVLLFAFGFFAVLRIDDASCERQMRFVQAGVADQVETLRREQRTVTVWDDSVERVKAGDQAWMEENLGAWMFSYYGHDRVYVLDAHNGPVHAMRAGATLDAQAYTSDRPVIEPVVAMMRTTLGHAVRDGLDVTKVVASDIVLIDGRAAIVDAQPIVPNSAKAEQAPGTEFVHVSVQFFDQEIVARISRQYQLANARIAPASMPNLASVPIAGADGVAKGYVVWTPYRPGMALMRRMVPAMAGAVFLIGGMVVFLLRRLRRASSALQQSRSEAQFLAFHDTLTGLPNRALFEDRLDRALAMLRRHDSRMALVLLDLDRFKQVNDTLGHPAGDELVRQFAQRLSESVREIDTVARLGGDEFALVLVDIRNLRTAELVCERILEDVAEPFLIDGNPVFASASVGIAVAPESGNTAQDMLRKADVALYEAKRRGRARFEVFAAGMDDLMTQRNAIERDLRVALQDGQALGLSFDPVFDSGGKVVGAAAELVWAHPVHGPLGGDRIRMIAEERGLSTALSNRMLELACDFAANARIAVSVPIAGHRLRENGAAQSIIATISDGGAPASLLRIAVTEDQMLRGGDTVLASLAALRTFGIGVVLDKFGTGAASLTGLRKYPVDQVMLDDTLAALATANGPSATVVRSLIEIASAMGRVVAAAGVESAEQRRALEAMDCEAMRGPLFSAPLSKGQFAAFMAARAETRVMA